jgi:hypothetical protein
MGIEAQSRAMTEKAQVNVKIDPEKKKRWVNYKDESPHVNSLSDLVRTGVAKEIAESETDDTTQSSQAEASEEVLTALSELQNQVRGMGERLEAVEQSTQQDPEITKLASEIFEILPTEEEVEKWVNGNDEIDYIPGDGAVVISGSVLEEEKVTTPIEEVPHAIESGTPEAIGSEVEAEYQKVDDALDKLADDMARVRSSEYDGKTRYWRDV